MKGPEKRDPAEGAHSNKNRERVREAEAIMRQITREFGVPADQALVHLGEWRPELREAYCERLASDAEFDARFQRRVRRYRTRTGWPGGRDERK